LKRAHAGPIARWPPAAPRTLLGIYPIFINNLPFDGDKIAAPNPALKFTLEPFKT
jgi:hypothetical protein